MAAGKPQVRSNEGMIPSGFKRALSLKAGCPHCGKAYFKFT